MHVRKKKTSKTKKTDKADTSHLKKSKSEGFLDKLKNDSAMVDYLTSLRIMNPAAELRKNLNEPRREGGFVRLAHANEEFTAPKLSKGKSVTSKKKEK